MKNKLIFALALLFALATLVSCKPAENTRPNDGTTSGSDWRNTIEYESFYYVNSETKLLYALDVGTITLWDNGGDGTPLQQLSYDSAAEDAIGSVRFEDMNSDGNADIVNLYSQTEKGSRYNLWLWDEELGKYIECKKYKAITDPVISDDGSSVSGTEDKGPFGNILTLYTFGEGYALEEASVTITNSDSIAQAICSDLKIDAICEKGNGSATINEVSCPVYYLQKNGARIGYIAYSPEGHWYLDEGCLGMYRTVLNTDGVYLKGTYTGDAGIMADLVAELADCPPGELTIGESSVGIICNLSYNEGGTPILPDPEADPVGAAARGYYFKKDGATLCHIVTAGAGEFYIFYPEITGDSFYHMIKTDGEAEIIPGTASEFIISEE